MSKDRARIGASRANSYQLFERCAAALSKIHNVIRSE
jgi:hypothetical protein